MGIKRIRRAVREDRYQFSSHALEEMDEDNLTEEDIRWVILHGAVVAELSDDPAAFASLCEENRGRVMTTSK